MEGVTFATLRPSDRHIGTLATHSARTRADAGPATSRRTRPGASYALAPGTGTSGGLDGSGAVVDMASSKDWPSAPADPPPPPANCPG